MTSLTAPLTIRQATPDDHLSLLRLAALDSAPSFHGDRVLLAEVAGELQAALSLDSGSAIADPFRSTQHIVALLRTHASMTAGTARRERRRAPLRPRYAVAW